MKAFRVVPRPVVVAGLDGVQQFASPQRHGVGQQAALVVVFAQCQ